jgi:hypothetical protein
MKKSELKEYIREAIIAELSEAVFVGPGAVDDITKNPAFQKVKDKNSVINALKVGDTVALEETDDDDDSSEKEPTASDLKKAEKELGKNSKHAKKLTAAEEERYDKLKKGITAKVNKLKDMSKSERAKSDDLKVLKSLINKKEVKDLFKAKGASLDSLVSGVIG